MFHKKMTAEDQRLEITNLMTQLLKDNLLRKNDPAPYLNTVWAVESPDFQGKLQCLLEG